MSQYSFIKLSDDIYTVGYFPPYNADNPAASRFVPLRDFKNPEEACAFINYLNGGDGKRFEIDDPGVKRRPR